MYTRPKRIYTNLKRMENYIEEEDVYNSLLLFKLQDPGLSTKEYTVKTPYRPDLIAEDFYGDANYESFVIFQLKRTIDQVTRGTILHLIEKSELDKILKSLN